MVMQSYKFKRDVDYGQHTSSNFVVETVDNLPNDAVEGRLVTHDGLLKQFDGAEWKILGRLPNGMYIEDGGLDCSGNPNYPVATAGAIFIVSVAGKIGGASGKTVAVGDQILCIISSEGGTQAQVGAEFVVNGSDVLTDGSTIEKNSSLCSKILSKAKPKELRKMECLFKPSLYRPLKCLRKLKAIIKVAWIYTQTPRKIHQARQIILIF